jgi:hypothetical protein
MDVILVSEQLWKRFRGEDKPPAHLGSSKDYNVDMVPKVLQSPPVQNYLYNTAIPPMLSMMTQTNPNDVTLFFS